MKNYLDIHCLIHPEFNRIWYLNLVSQLINEPDIIFHQVWNEKSITEGRIIGYNQGNSPYIGFVDSDDLIEPGIFSKILLEFEKGADVVSCNEMLIDEYDKIIAPGLLLQPNIYSKWLQNLFSLGINHHIFCFKRELLDIDYIKNSAIEIAKYPQSLGDYTFSAVKDIANKKSVLINEVGYYYRRYRGQITGWLNERRTEV